MCYDVTVIGAGVIGALTARELSKYNLKVALVEASNDVAMGASKANSGIVHAGFDAKPGTLKAQLNVKGCAMMSGVCADLSVPYKKNGSLVVAFSSFVILFSPYSIFSLKARRRTAFRQTRKLS